MPETEYTIKAAFERMHVCGNKERCSSYGDDTPDASPGDNRCFMCGVEKVYWTTIPLEDIPESLRRCLKNLELVEV